MDQVDQVESVSSNLSGVIKKLRKVLDELQAISESDLPSRGQRLMTFVTSANDTSILPLLYKLSIRRRRSIDYLRTRFPIVADVARAPPHVQSSPRKASLESKHPKCLPPIFKKSSSYNSEVNLLGDKSEKHTKCTSQTLPEPLPLSSKSLHFESIKRHGNDLSGEDNKPDVPLTFYATCGESEEIPVDNAQSEHENEVGFHDARVWDSIFQKGNELVKAMSPIEESSNDELSEWQTKLQKENKRLEDLMLEEMEAKTNSQELSILKQDQEIRKLKEDHDKAMNEIERWNSLCENLKSKIAKKEKECYQLHCNIDEQLTANGSMDKVQVIELHIWNVELALKLCSKLLHSKGTARSHAMKTIIEIAKSAKGLEQIRPWTT